MRIKLTDIKAMLEKAKAMKALAEDLTEDTDTWYTYAIGEQPVFDVNVYREEGKASVCLYPLTPSTEDVGLYEGDYDRWCAV
jgi:hypothetical protein